MDFASLISKEIAKKKGAVAPPPADEVDSSKAPAKGPELIHRGAIVQTKREQYLREQAQRDKERQEKAERARREREEEEARREEKRRAAEEVYREKKRKQKELEEAAAREEAERKKAKRARSSATPGAESARDTPENENDRFKTMTDAEIVAELRRFDEPIRLFNESDDSRLRRLRRIERKKGKTLGIEERLREVDMVLTERDIILEPRKVYLQLEKYLQFVLAEWEKTLKNMEDTPEQALLLLDETKEYLEPLFEHFRQRNLHDQIYQSFATLILYLQNQQYHEANDTYLKLSIGNAAWPIGVTAVGIHERSSRERITGHDNETKPGALGKTYVQVAHVMSDDETRKWLTAIKRMMTFIESHWPEI
ncbi:Prp18 domain-containing protein [Dipodascopsis tothii]|uniref:Prp18 domain-containing protein n=1 Tax=Dipodascopsis tothii TaxID=44089 RepID=UPI0034CD8C71